MNIEKIEKIKNKGKVKPLIKALNDKDPSVRKAAAQALGTLGSKEAAEPLIKCLEDEEWVVRRAAAKELGSLGDVRAVEALIRCLADKRSDVVEAVVEALAALGDKRAVEPLINRLAKGSVSTNRKAVQALVALGDKTTVDTLINRLTDENGQGTIVRKYVVEVLGALGDKRAVDSLIPCLTSSNSQLRLNAIEALDRLGESQWTKCRAHSYSLSERYKMDSLTSLGQTKDTRLVDPLIEGLADERRYDQKEIVQVLGELGDKRAVEPLIGFLTDRNGSVRVEAAKALAALGEVQWKEYIAGECRDFIKLAQAKDTRFVEPLKVRLFDIDSGIRRAAAIALDKLGESQWKDYIRGENEDFERIAQTKDKKHVEPLLKCLEYKGLEVRKAAAKGLIELAAHNQELVLDKTWISLINEKHTDGERHSDSHKEFMAQSHYHYGCELPNHSDSRYHEDKGIGIQTDF